ncbi:MAG: hypothetical protein IPH85_00015 [Ignavibacteria bacterium]|nr:hypothetical protein [Ignavibacteria bacterium]
MPLNKKSIEAEIKARIVEIAAEMGRRRGTEGERNHSGYWPDRLDRLARIDRVV